MPNNSTYSAEDLDRTTISTARTNRTEALIAPLPIDAGIERLTTASMAPFMPIRYSAVWGSSRVRDFSPVNNTLA
jgi:hypothetical protein